MDDNDSNDLCMQCPNCGARETALWLSERGQKRKKWADSFSLLAFFDNEQIPRGH